MSLDIAKCPLMGTINLGGELLLQIFSPEKYIILHTVSSLSNICGLAPTEDSLVGTFCKKKQRIIQGAWTSDLCSFHSFQCM